MTDAYVHVMVEPGAVTKAAETIAKSEAVEQVQLVTGEADLVVRIDVENKDDIAHVVTDEIHGVSGVFDTQTSVAFDL